MSAIALATAVVANLGAAAWSLWRWQRGQRALDAEIAALADERAELARRPVPILSAKSAFTLYGHPSTTSAELQDALRFGFAAAQKYLDELAAEYGISDGE